MNLRPTSLRLAAAAILGVVSSLVACGGAVDPSSGDPSADANSDANPDADTSVETAVPGSDRDAHGCIGSAGYQWCATDMACERPWEVTMNKGLPDTPEAFTAYCSGATPTPTPSDAAVPDDVIQAGGDRDARGCIGSAGYQWCAKEMACERPWDLAALKGFPNTAAGFAGYCGT